MAVQNAYNENELLKAVADGDEQAFTEIFHHFRNKVYSIAYKITGAGPVSEEILLDVFLKVWLKREELPRVKHFSAWLFTITRNRVFSTLKQMALRKEAETSLYPDDYLLQSANPNTLLLEKEYQQVLQQAVSKLSPQQRKVYNLIKERGLKREEAAEELNLSPETVKRHLSEAMYVIRAHCLSHLGVYAVLLIIKQLL